MENKISKFIRLPEVIHRTGKSKTSIYTDIVNTPLLTQPQRRELSHI